MVCCKNLNSMNSVKRIDNKHIISSDIIIVDYSLEISSKELLITFNYSSIYKFVTANTRKNCKNINRNTYYI